MRGDAVPTLWCCRVESPGSAAIFAGKSEMARLMREYDWTTTPLGPPPTWSKSLQTVVRMLLTSR